MSALAIQPYIMPTSTPQPGTAAPQEEPTSINDALATRALASARTRWNLSARECQVIAHLAEGDANKEIAAKLSCALRTVEAHVTSILQKARCDSRAKVVAHFWRGQ